MGANAGDAAREAAPRERRHQELSMGGPVLLASSSARFFTSTPVVLRAMLGAWAPTVKVSYGYVNGVPPLGTSDPSIQDTSLGDSTKSGVTWMAGVEGRFGVRLTSAFVVDLGVAMLFTSVPSITRTPDRYPQDDQPNAPRNAVSLRAFQVSLAPTLGLRLDL